MGEENLRQPTHALLILNVTNMKRRKKALAKEGKGKGKGNGGKGERKEKRRKGGKKC